MNFQSRSFGKCILAGEHSVLRSYPALAIPVSSCFFDLKYKSQADTDVFCQGENKEQIELAFLGGLERALQLVGKSKSEVQGRYDIINTIPLGTGMGGSAGVCVAIARFFSFKNWISENQVIEFATEVEHLFHGRSSGVDVAVSALQGPIRFLKNEKPQELTWNWRPHLAISYCGQPGFTSECIDIVEKLIKDNPSLGAKTDETMGEAVRIMEEALLLDPAQGVNRFSEAMELAHKCFENWGLVSPALQVQMEKMSVYKPLAMKPTGSGMGGYILGFWAQNLPDADELKII